LEFPNLNSIIEKWKTTNYWIPVGIFERSEIKTIDNYAIGKLKEREILNFSVIILL